MVYLNGLKYACEACIKGHRSSTCSHTDRALFEIKKKGRPVTQCHHCRQLRKTKQVHVKCSCEGGADNGSGNGEPRGKAKRKMPTSATFPDGLGSQSLSPSPAPQGKSSPSTCRCDSSGVCTCVTYITKKPNRSRLRAPSSEASSAPATPPPIQPQSSCCGGKSNGNGGIAPNIQPGPNTYPPLLDESTSVVPQAHASTSYSTNELHSAHGVSLPTSFSWEPGVTVGSCSCGITCTCPGCYEHSNLSTALMSWESCPYACSTCSECNGFGFNPSPNPEWNNVGGGNTTQMFQTFDTWPVTAPLPALVSTSAGPAALPSPHVSSFDCCGGSCQCTAQALPCHCAPSCCGCCLGCSCSDSDSVAADHESGMGESLGFAISGERGSCCTESKGGRDVCHANKNKVRHEDRGGPLHMSHPITESPTLFQAPFYGSNTALGAEVHDPVRNHRSLAADENGFGRENEGGSSGAHPDQWT